MNVLPAFFLILVRVGAFLASVPLFSYRNIPVSHKIGSAVFLAWIMLSAMGAPEVSINGGFIVDIMTEAIVGLSLGLLAALWMYAFQVAGGFIDLQMGFSIASVFDPQTGVQTPLMGKFLYYLAILLLFALDGHHLLLDGIFYSYKYVPLGATLHGFETGEAGRYAVTVVAGMFLIAFQMALPIVGTLFLVDVALGIMARTVPQMNIFVVGIPLKILVAFLLFLVIMPAFFLSVRYLSEEMANAMRELLILLQER